jgi:hypothetical protein
VRKPHGISPRKPYVRVRMTAQERNALLVLLDSVDHQDGLAIRSDLRAYENIAWRRIQAEVKFPLPAIMKSNLKSTEGSIMAQSNEQLQGERLIGTLINLPRVKLDLIAFTSKDGTQRDFALRKVVWTGAGGSEGTRGYEIKLDREVARELWKWLKLELEADQVQTVRAAATRPAEAA